LSCRKAGHLNKRRGAPTRSGGYPIYFRDAQLDQIHEVSRAMSGRSTIAHVPKPWGPETIWATTEAYVGKILHINAGEALSVQFHNVKDETVYLLTGELIYRVWEGDTPVDVQLKVGEAYRITPGTVHQMEAVTDCDILEVSTPHLNDVVRLTDRYGREGTNAP
jgi:mannose-6-phosphate isomerase